MDTLKSALERYNQAVAAMKEVQAAHPNGEEFSVDQQAKWDRASADMVEAKTFIDRSQAIPQSLSPSLYLPSEPKPTNTYTQGDALTSWARLHTGLGATEKDVEIARSFGFSPTSNLVTVKYDHLTVGSDAAGGYAVNDGTVGALVQARDNVGILRSYATIYQRSNGEPFSVPTNNDTTNYATVVAEGATVASGVATAPTFGTASLTPYKLDTKYLTFSEELLKDTQFDFATFIGGLVGDRVFRGQQFYAAQGTGSSQPGSLVSGGTSALTAASATAVTFDEVRQLIFAVDEMYRNSPSSRIVMNGTTLGELATLDDGVGRPLINFNVDGSCTLYGQKVLIVSQMNDTAATKKPIVCGDLKYLAMSEVPSLELQFANELYRANGMIGVRAYYRCNSNVTNASAIKYITMHA